MDDLDFANDLALLSHSQTQMQAKTTELNRIAKHRSVGLRTYQGKTKIFIVNTANEATVAVNEKGLEEVDFC